MSGTMIAGIVIFGVGVLVFIAGAVLGDREGEGYLFIGCIICVIGMMIMISCAWTAKEAKTQESVYPMTTRVIVVDYDEDTVVCEDFNGNRWAFNGCEDWEVGDIASLLMNDKGTKIVYDDEIVDARYDGWFEGWN